MVSMISEEDLERIKVDILNGDLPLNGLSYTVKVEVKVYDVGANEIAKRNIVDHCKHNRIFEGTSFDLFIDGDILSLEIV